MVGTVCLIEPIQLIHNIKLCDWEFNLVSPIDGMLVHNISVFLSHHNCTAEIILVLYTLYGVPGFNKCTVNEHKIYWWKNVTQKTKRIVYLRPKHSKN